MDDIQLIIYIAFLILYFITRGLKGKKKKTPASTRPKARPETKKAPPVTFEELLKEFTGQSQKKEVPDEALDPIQEFESEYPTDDEIDEVYKRSVKEGEKFQSIDEVITLEPETAKFKEYQDKDEENPYAIEIIDMLQSPEDARKAIILKEVLDRKF